MTEIEGTFGYDAGSGAATVDVPERGDIDQITAIAGAGACTCQISGGDAIPIPAGASFTTTVVGALLGADVVFTGPIAAYYVSWVQR
jgi:hypothetical protein